MPLMMALISDASWTGFQTAMYVLAAIVCGWIPILLALRARRENGFVTIWELASGTRVLVRPKGSVRPSIETDGRPEITAGRADSLGPYRIIKEMVPGKWIVATDPILRRQVWLIGRNTLKLPLARRDLSRYGRLRWLQKIEAGEVTWDAFEATEGVPFSSLVEGGKRLPWSSLRHWLHDLASELWDATADKTLPPQLGLDHVWITTQGHAILLDEPWPDVEKNAESIAVGDLAGQQRFLNAIAECVDSTSLPLHARGVLNNLNDGKFEKLSFLTGILRGLLDKPVDVNRGLRAGSIFMLGFYVWVAFFVGYYHDKEWTSVGPIIMTSAMLVLGIISLVQLMELPFRSTASQFTFRLAVVNAKGQRASRVTLLKRWAIVWLPLFVPMVLAIFLNNRGEQTAAFIFAAGVFVLWVSAAFYAVVHPNRGLHDRLAGTWVVRQ
jgi:hypothetical protein